MLDGGTEILSGPNSYTGTTVVNGGALELGAATIAYNVTDNATLGFNSSSAIAMSGVVSGSGGLSQLGTGVTALSAVQTYSGPTTIGAGTLALAGSGSAIAASNGVTDNGTLDVSAATSPAMIASLAGSGTVNLGSQSLTLTNASGAFSGIIAGTGGLTLAGGTETLSGKNSFTGPTTITGGTLSLAGISNLSGSSGVIDNATLDVSAVSSIGVVTTASINSLSGSGAVTLGAGTLILTNAADTFSGVISGSGNLTVSGGTEEFLAGANMYTGLTTISDGTLRLASTGGLAATSMVTDNGVLDISATTGGPVTLASLSGSGTVNLGAQSLNLANASTSFSGAITGTGGVIISGGAQTLSGINSYTGGTSITAGTLQIGDGRTNGAIVGNVADSGTLAFDTFGSSVYGGIISGSGVVVQNGSGIIILTGANTYTGGTSIAAGTLQIGNGTTAGSFVGGVVDNGTLAFGRSDTTTYGGTISGTGGVTVVSGGLVLTAINSYGGVTTIDSGASLALSGSASIASSSGMTDNGTFDVSGVASPQIAALAGSGAVAVGSQSLTVTNGTGSFSGTISGTGGLTVTGGTQTLSGVNAYTGATTINGGTLAVNGSIASSSGVAVNSGGILAGTGTVPSVTLASGSAISPGVAGAGTLHVNGTVAFAFGSSMVVPVSSDSAGTLALSGSEVS